MSKKLVTVLLLLIFLAGTVLVAGIAGTASASYPLNDSYAAFIPLVFQGREQIIEFRFAVIGDYGNGSQNEADVSALVKSWNPDLIITTGDNNYPDGSAGTIDEHIGQFFHEFIAPYKGSFGKGAQENRFYPSLGNHDWHAQGAKPYLDYFTLPGNERYYDFTWGAVHFFVIDSDTNEPDGAYSSSVQAAWLQSKLASSNSPWKIVYFHHAPYSSARHGSNERMQWPFAQWGADAVITGHDHTYERISMDGIWYFVNGLGGSGRYNFVNIIDGSQVRYNEDHGAMLVEVGRETMHFKFINRLGTIIDSFELHQSEKTIASRAPQTVP